MHIWMLNLMPQLQIKRKLNTYIVNLHGRERLYLKELQTPWKIKSIFMTKLNVKFVLPSFYLEQGEDRLVLKRISYLRISHESVTAMCWAFSNSLSYDGFLGLNSCLIQKQSWNLSEEALHKYQILWCVCRWVLVYFI